MYRALVLLLAVFACPDLRAEPVTVFAAASLKPVLDDVLDDAPVDTRAVYAGSSALARQILAGAPADLYISANTEWMDYVEDAGLVASGSRQDIVRNRLVLVGPAPAAEDPLGSLAGQRIAVALTEAVPAGIYAKAALMALGLWETVRPGLVETQDVRAALRLATTGAAPFAIVYATDARSASMTALHTFSEDSHPPIVYPAAILLGAAPESSSVFKHIIQAETTFAAAGFLPPEAE